MCLPPAKNMRLLKNDEIIVNFARITFQGGGGVEFQNFSK